jgi:hypothetical protein
MIPRVELAPALPGFPGPWRPSRCGRRGWLSRQQSVAGRAAQAVQAAPGRYGRADGCVIARVRHSEHGAVQTIELLARYLDAIGGGLEITPAFDGTKRVVQDGATAYPNRLTRRPSSRRTVVDLPKPRFGRGGRNIPPGANFRGPRSFSMDTARPGSAQPAPMFPRCCCRRT